MTCVVRAVVSLLIGSLVFIGLPLAGWGLSDIGGFFDHPGRMAYAVLAVVSMAFAVAFVPDSGRGSGKGKKLVERQHGAVILLQVFSLAVVVVAPWCDHRGIAVLGGMDALRYWGLALYLLGYALMNWAVIALGRQFSLEVTIQEGHRLVTSGPYRYLRHPRYTGIILFFGGISLVFRSLIALGLSLAVILVLIWRIRDEEEMMRREFGEEWDGYSRKTRRLIPLIY